MARLRESFRPTASLMALYCSRHGVPKEAEDFMPKIGAAKKPSGMGPEVFHAFLEAADAA